MWGLTNFTYTTDVSHIAVEENSLIDVMQKYIVSSSTAKLTIFNLEFYI